MTDQVKGYELRELGLGEIYSKSLAIVMSNLGTILGVVSLTYVPFYVAVYFMAQGMMPAEPDISSLEELAAYAAEVESVDERISSIALAIENLTVFPITAAAMMFIVAGLYSGQKIGVGAALSRALARLFPLLGTYLLFALAVFGGMIMLIIPGVVFLIWFLLSTEIAVLEGIAGPKALSRSRQLMRGASAALLLLLLGLGLTVAVIQYVATFALAMLPWAFAGFIGVVIVEALCMAVVQVAWVLYYFSARCRHESFTVEMLRESIAPASSSVDG